MQHEIGSDRIPAPLVVIASVSWRDEWDQIQARLRQSLPVREDPDLSAVLRLAADPDTTATVIGAGKEPIRLYCALTQRNAVALAQMPGPADESGGNVIVRTGTHTSVATWVARFAGDQPAGSAPPMSESVAALNTPTQALGLDYGEVSTGDRIHDLLNAARTGQGYIEVERGRHHPDGPTRKHVSWFDVENDGRYVYRYRHAELTVEPCSPTRFGNIVSRMVGSTVNSR
ncbi:ESX secretion-associated protein EspG [Nocardia sp. NPDC058705]|uniref:ESX secretion-associated protein EspG n=1 Tax=Nocardia sp. NPDC058705 TaxID=3346609 RepID=UPI0036BB3DA6